MNTADLFMLNSKSSVESIFSQEFLINLALLFSCYAYILLIILISGRTEGVLGFTRKSSRKFLHIMVGNLPFVIPFFSLNYFPMNFPFFVAAPFILVTFLVSPYSPLKRMSMKFRGLSGITEEGHQLGLVFYAVSYTILAVFFSAKPYVIAAGILPMAYGDASASLVGEKYGKHRYRLFARKSFEGSIAMFSVSFLAVAASMFFFSIFYSFTAVSFVLVTFVVASVAAVAEGISPLGFDNVTVPILCALTFLWLSRGI